MSTVSRRSACQSALCAAALALLAGCAPPQQRSTPAAATGPWSGRIHLRVDDSDAPRSFTAHFELQGTARSGSLELSTPLGTLLARLQWSAGEASIETAQERRNAPSLESLLRDVTGEALPVDALFDWLMGVPTIASGWQADLQQLEQGRLNATRTQPHPPATLRILLNP